MAQRLLSRCDPVETKILSPEVLGDISRGVEAASRTPFRKASVEARNSQIDFRPLGCKHCVSERRKVVAHTLVHGMYALR